MLVCYGYEIRFLLIPLSGFGWIELSDASSFCGLGKESPRVFAEKSVAGWGPRSFSSKQAVVTNIVQRCVHLRQKISSPGSSHLSIPSFLDSSELQTHKSVFSFRKHCVFTADLYFLSLHISFPSRSPWPLDSHSFGCHKEGSAIQNLHLLSASLLIYRFPFFSPKL